MTQVTTEVHRSRRSDGKSPVREHRRQESGGWFYTPVDNSVFLDRQLSTKARQILLILELRAGASRVARLSHRQIVGLTGYPLRTVERALRALRKRGSISPVQNGVIRLCDPIPTEKYVTVYEGVVHHPQWEDWQKHLLLFVMSQFRGRDSDWGIGRHTLNLYGRQGRSIEKYCRIPGSVKERRRRFRQFIEQLKQDGLIRIIEPATSSCPAVCTVDREALEQLPPDCDRHGSAAFRTAGSVQKQHRHTLRSDTDTRNAAHRHTTRSSTVTRNAAAPSSVTHVEKSEKTEDSGKIPESPLSAFGGRGAISSQFREEAPDAAPESGPAPTWFLNHVTAAEGFASLMSSSRHRQLTEEVDEQCYGSWLCESSAEPPSLARRWTEVLTELPEDVEAQDVVPAIQSAEFANLKTRSWGLLLSDKFIARFLIEIHKNYRARLRRERETQSLYEAAVASLQAADRSTREKGIKTLAESFRHRRTVPLLIARLLEGRHIDPESSVRVCALIQLSSIRLDIRQEDLPAIVRCLKKLLAREQNRDVREWAELLIRECDQRDTAG